MSVIWREVIQSLKPSFFSNVQELHDFGNLYCLVGTRNASSAVEVILVLIAAFAKRKEFFDLV